MKKKKKEQPTQYMPPELPALTLTFSRSCEDFVQRNIQLVSRGYSLAEAQKGMRFLLEKYHEIKKGDTE